MWNGWMGVILFMLMFEKYKLINIFWKYKGKIMFKNLRLSLLILLSGFFLMIINIL